jgi:adenosylcobinamide-GDP ribazoletransferase
LVAPVYQASTEEQLANAMEFLTDLARSLAFLSRLPVPSRFFTGHDGSVSRACRAFPAAGFLVALAPALLLWLTAGPHTGLLSAFLALGLMAFLTGGLHEDGLADSADGLFGGRDKEKVLAIMKDSRTGAYGVIALILSFGIRAASLAALAAGAGAGLAALALLAAAALSRALMIWHWSALGAARENGTAVAVGHPLPGARTLALAIGVCATLPLLLAGLSPVTLLLSLAACALALHRFTRFVQRVIGGYTGDTIGASQQITETTLLLALAILI